MSNVRPSVSFTSIPRVSDQRDRSAFSPQSVRRGRITGRELQRRRQRWFEKFPLCVACWSVGRSTAAAELDHIVPLFKGGADDETNLQGLCVECHYDKTQIDLGKVIRPRVSANGYPIESPVLTLIKEQASLVAAYEQAMGEGAVP